MYRAPPASLKPALLLAALMLGLASAPAGAAGPDDPEGGPVTLSYEQIETLPDLVARGIFDEVGNLGLEFDSSRYDDNPREAIKSLRYGEDFQYALQELRNENGVENNTRFSRYLATGKVFSRIIERPLIRVHVVWAGAPDEEYGVGFNSRAEAAGELRQTDSRYVIREKIPGVAQKYYETEGLEYTRSRILKPGTYPGLTGKKLVERVDGNFAFGTHVSGGSTISEIRPVSGIVSIHALAMAGFRAESGAPYFLQVYVNAGTGGYFGQLLDEALIDNILRVAGRVVHEQTGAGPGPQEVPAGAQKPTARPEPAAPEPEDKPGAVTGIAVLDANPLFSPDGKTMAGDLKPSELIRAEVTRKGTIADGVSRLILRAEVSGDVPVRFALRAGGGAITPLLGGRTVELGEKFYAFALYSPPGTFDAPKGGIGPKSPLEPPQQRLGEILEMREVRVSAGAGQGDGFARTFVLARPPVVLVHGLFSDPIQTWVNTFPDGASMVALLERAGFLSFMVNYQNSSGMLKTGSWMTDDAGKASSFADNRRVVWDSPQVDYDPVRYEYGFLDEEPIRSELQKPRGARIGGISQALKYYRDDLGLAATQAIVIGHSMGGLLTRVWASPAYNPDYRRPENYMEGDIDRLLTLNTPHFGSELVELKDALGKAAIGDEGWLQWARRQLANTAVWWLIEPEPGAVTDLRPGSRALRRIGPTRVPSYAIATSFSSAQAGAGDKDPYKLYEALYSFAGMVFFNNRPLLDDFVQSRFTRWRNTAAPYRRNGDWRGQDGLDLSDGASLARYRDTIARNMDANAYYWAARREADFQDDLRATLRNTVIGRYGVVESSMGNDGELDMLSPFYLFSNALTGTDVTRFFDETKASDVPDTFLSILRDLVFHNDPNTDGAVRVVSQTGGLEASEVVANVVHSYSPWDYNVQRRVLFLLKSEIGSFDADGFPEAGQLTPRYMPSAELSEPRVSGDEAIAWSGMVPSHAAQYLRVADERDVFVLVRPVNASSTGLLAENAAAKGMNVKGKSSNWGPHVGFIPFDQKYSKLWRVVKDPIKRRLDIEKYNGETRESTTATHPEMPGRTYAVTRPLRDVRTVNGLCNVVTDPQEEDAENAVFLDCDGRLFRWQNGMRNNRDVFDPGAALEPAELGGDRQARVLANPMLVLADGTADADPKPYLTADYDLLAIGFRFDAEQCASGAPPAPGGAVDCIPAPTSGVANADFDPLRGYISPRQMDLLEEINGAVAANTGYSGGLVTHHGPENQYPKSPYVDYPILVFDPMDSADKSDGVAYLVRMGPPGFRDIHLKRLFAEKNRLGYNLWPNPVSRAWRWQERRGFDMVRGYDPRDARDLPPYVEEAPRPAPGAGNAGRVARSGAAQGPAQDPVQDPPPAQEAPTEYGLRVNLIVLSAEQGNAFAQMQLGEMYRAGYPFPRDYELAASWYRRAAEQGNREARYQLGRLYEAGEGVAQNLFLAAEWYRQAAGQGSLSAQLVLGEMLETGRGVARDYREAETWYRAAADQDSAPGRYRLARLYETMADDVPGAGPGPRAVVDLYRRAAEQGHGEAQLKLAERLADGQGVEQDQGAAVTWFRRAAEQGMAEAQFRLGEAYDFGRGVQSSPQTAVIWYRRAADQGHARAQYNLALSYDFGDGVDEDKEEAVKWYRLAAEQGHAPAQYNLGVSYDFGEGVARDFEAAVQWYRRAAEQGHAKAQYSLGLSYKLGEGVAEDMAQALGWYRLAAEQGLAEAQFGLGMAYDFGQGVAQNYRLAAEWYRLAAEQGYDRAQSNLGVLYEYGDGVAQDYGAAAEWYRLAAEQGHARAQDNLGLIYAEGLGVARDAARAAEWFALAAEQDIASAQYHLGQAYENGDGVPRDYVRAHMFYNISAMQGYDEADTSRVALEREMTLTEMSQALGLARKWVQRYRD